MLGFILITDAKTSTGVVSGSFVATTTESTIEAQARNSATNLSFDNVSTYQTDGTDIIHVLPNGWYPQEVFIDGLLVDEGAGDDYIIDTDGFRTWIKPTVAPGVLTRTRIKAVKV